MAYDCRDTLGKAPDALPFHRFWCKLGTPISCSSNSWSTGLLTEQHCPSQSLGLPASDSPGYLCLSPLMVEQSPVRILRLLIWDDIDMSRKQQALRDYCNQFQFHTGSCGETPAFAVPVWLILGGLAVVLMISALPRNASNACGCLTCQCATHGCLAFPLIRINSRRALENFARNSRSMFRARQPGACSRL